MSVLRENSRPGRAVALAAVLLAAGVSMASPGAAAADAAPVDVEREGLTRIGTEAAVPEYGTRMAKTCLQALGVDGRRLATVLAHPILGLWTGAGEKEASR